MLIITSSPPFKDSLYEYQPNNKFDSSNQTVLRQDDKFSLSRSVINNSIDKQLFFAIS